MKKVCLILTLAITTSNSFAQRDTLTNNPHKDITIRILSEIQTEGDMSGGVSVGNYGKTYRFYRLCEHRCLEIDTLSQYCTNREIDALLEDPNGSLKAVGFILYAKRYNNKDSVLTRLKLLLQQDYVIFNLSGCSDAITISNLARYCYVVMRGHTLLFKPNFALNRVDTIRIEGTIYSYERKASNRKSVTYFNVEN